MMTNGLETSDILNRVSNSKLLSLILKNLEETARIIVTRCQLTEGLRRCMQCHRADCIAAVFQPDTPV